MRKPDHLKAFREVPKAGVFWDSFSEMQEAVAMHTMALGKVMVRKCNFSGCAQPDLEVSFKRCSGCEDVLYCSVECQKADWTEERHKPYCRERAKSPEDRLAEYAISDDDHTSLEVAFGFDLYRHGLIQNPNLPFHEGEYKNFSHPLVTFDYTTFPPNSTIEEKEDGVAGQLTCVGRFLHGKGGLIFQAELPDPLDNWPLASASDFHKLRIRKECHPQ
ncbi:hypothetical protein H0H93_011391 [Arthromyces matolae]|nr:hypothetical protein H0H93_011391 [Arthromyces matolae]